VKATAGFALALALGFATVVPLAAAAIVFFRLDPAQAASELDAFARSPVTGWWPRLAALGHMPPVVFSGTLFTALCAAAFAACLTALGRGPSRKAMFGPAAARTHEQGSAEVDTSENRIAANTRTWDGRAAGAARGLAGGGGIVYGYSRRHKRYYIASGEDHAIVIGAPKAGKSRRVLLQSIYVMARAGDSMVVVDPKGELFSMTHRFLEGAGHKVMLIDMRSPRRSHLQNPLTDISEVYFSNMALAKECVARALDAQARGAHTPHGAQRLAPGSAEHWFAEAASHRTAAREGAEARAMDIAQTIVPMSPDSRASDFWTSSARGLLTAIILLVATYDRGAIEADLAAQAAQGDAATRLFIAEKAAALPVAIEREQRTLASVAELLNTRSRARTVTDRGGRRTEADLEAVFAVLPEDDPARRAYAQALNSSGETLSGMVVSAQNELNKALSEGFNSFAYDSDFKWGELAEGPTAVFIVLPDDRPARAIPGIMYITQAYQALTDIANGHGGTLPRRVQFILEEAGSYPVPIPNLDTACAVSRQRNIVFTIVIQDYQQLIRLYGTVGAASIKANCNTTVFLKTNLLETAREISQRLGRYTYTEASQSRSLKALAFSGGQEGETRRLMSRDWLTPDEVLKWPARFGNIVFRAYPDKEPKGLFASCMVCPAIVPSPDISRTPTQAALGLGDKAHNRRLWEEDEAIDRRAARKSVVPWAARRDDELPERNVVSSIGEATAALASLVRVAMSEAAEAPGQPAIGTEGAARAQLDKACTWARHDLAAARRMAKAACDRAGVGFEPPDVSEAKAAWAAAQERDIRAALSKDPAWEWAPPAQGPAPAANGPSPPAPEAVAGAHAGPAWGAPAFTRPAPAPPPSLSEWLCGQGSVLERPGRQRAAPLSGPHDEFACGPVPAKQVPDYASLIDIERKRKEQ
jgi:type IV secretory pathway TraG/TraD family ATPase VirD4